MDFVGSQFNGPAGLGDHDHQGHPGWRIDQLDANIVGWLRATGPRTVLLHIGTNDVLQNNNLAGAPARLSTLVDRITATVPEAEVFVATIIPLTNPGQEANARAFNATIPAMVQSKANARKHVHLVDMHSALTTADLIDGIHPTATGYDKMAAAWYAALLSVPGSLTGTGRPLVGTQSGRCADVTGVATTNGTAVQLYDCNGQTNQSWNYTASQQLTVYGTKCLDASGQASGSSVIIWDCDGQTDQQWTATAGSARARTPHGPARRRPVRDGRGAGVRLPADVRGTCRAWLDQQGSAIPDRGRIGGGGSAGRSLLGGRAR